MTSQRAQRALLTSDRSGDDGRWSTFDLKVGTPPQTVRLLPGTSAGAGSSIWVVLDIGCDIVNPNLTDCEDARGFILDNSTSTTWSTQGLENGIDGAIYALNTLEESLVNRQGNGSYGFDTVTLGMLGSGLPSLEHQVIAGIWTNDFFVGSLGLSAHSFNFSSFNDPQPSMLSSLKNQSHIPSLSWGYSAGAAYRAPEVFGSLTLGGYDASRVEANNMSFAFGPDISRDLVVSLQSITHNTVGTTVLQARSIDVLINSMVPELWLPVETCEAFATQFNLTWSEAGQVYFVNETAHTALLRQNPSFYFTLGHSGTSDGDTVEIVLPYAAFDLNLTAPIVAENQSSWYFPIKQAQSPEQYTLGRTFLQEAYVVTDYERRNFSVAQARVPPASAAQEMITIRSVDDESEQVRSRLSARQIAGIVVGSIVVVLALATAALILWRRQHKAAAARMKDDSMPPKNAVEGEVYGAEADGQETEVRELDDDNQLKPELLCCDGTGSRHELRVLEVVQELDHSQVKFELHAEEALSELEGHPLPH